MCLLRAVWLSVLLLQLPAEEWDLVSPLAKQLVNGLLVVDPAARMTPAQVRRRLAAVTRAPLWLTVFQCLWLYGFYRFSLRL